MCGGGGRGHRDRYKNRKGERVKANSERQTIQKKKQLEDTKRRKSSTTRRKLSRTGVNLITQFLC